MTELDWVYSLNSKIPRGKSLPEGVKRYAAVVSYDGSAFCGFQKQKHSPSVQQELERALSSVANSEIVVSCAGRTDTAVHASYQVVHFDTPALRTGRNWVKGSNSQLPDSVALLWADEVAESFHARFSATSRTYRYVIHAAPARPAILSQGVTWVRNPLNTAAMLQACQYLLGEQDFSAFRGAGCQSLSPNRNITSAKIIQAGELIVFEVTANAFVLHMVRNIIGSLMEVGFGRRDPGWIGQLIKGRDRTKSAATASPKGLYLVNVAYPTDSAIPLMPKGPLFLNI
ncbi:tRNA pseudouridine(38-40) synthase TruA [Porticoccaceae bacterium]|nr:tRNA pseudouridine(38-40) synthase TruA [Porticoccaceae bacterium]MDB9706694.1 tRNA pseudouridine(38-40) synthase TruA [Porticoccaceae bacterium]MDB9736963.1 tRNA pseudouridine(38-40) synthase TruA [Porticoccaceae bacterium]MDB9793081.1 tRNA pseudouridine(38-40) synthase TruA [bacterium]MDB9948684.1 tRNA pseudouridine(38-40) synthase TruA [Porticoccaceae bacterium]